MELKWLVVTLMSLTHFVISAQYTNEWAVEVHGGVEEAKVVAKETGCVYQGHVIDQNYLLICHHVNRRSVEPHVATHSDLTGHRHVRNADQQVVLSRKKRQPPNLWRMQHQQPQLPPQQQQYYDSMHLNDQRWPQMWYLNRGQRLDMNVQEAWQMGITGKGVSISILDDGIERTHPDLVANYDALASFDVNQNDNDPTPRYDLIDSNRHGTRCAGEVAATANNSNCAVGIAYGSGIGGVRMLDGDVTDAVEARSLGLNNQHIDIYSASWGPDDDGKTVDGPGRLATRAFLQGITSGRSGKGSIFVWASGNGGRDYDNCNCDGYTNSIWTLSVSSATENGLIPWYSEACSSTLATTYSSGSTGERKVVTTDLHHTCTSSHTGTSASAPLAAGIVALTLHANPSLTWRDVQHLTVRCAHNANLRANDWAANAVGRNYSHSFGYGLMDATCMVKLAQKWKPVAEQMKCSTSADRIDLVIQARSRQTAKLEVKSCDKVNYMEHVQAHVTLAASKRGDVQIALTSPKGTRSFLIAKRPKDYSRAGFNDWPFLTVHMWEESPVGTWTLEVLNDGKAIVELKEWSISVFGTEEHPQPNLSDNEVKNLNNIPPPPPASPAPTSKPTIAEPIQHVGPAATNQPNNAQSSSKALKLDNCLEPDSAGWCSVCESGFMSLSGRCVEQCPAEGYFVGQENHKQACLQCYYTCKTCNGPSDYQCLECYGDAQLEEESPDFKYCHNKSLINRVFSSSRWYYVLSIGFLVNFCIILVLVVYIVRWRRNNRALLSSTSMESGGKIVPPSVGNGVTKTNSGLHLKKPWGSGNNNSKTRGYSPVKLADNGVAKTTSAVPFHDYDTSSEEDELFRKPYSDQVK